jgi:hypothetical protein
LVLINFVTALFSARRGRSLVGPGRRPAHFEGEWVAHAKTQKRQFLAAELDGGSEGLEEHSLDHLLPDVDAAATRDTFARASTAVYVVGWGLSVYYLGVLALSTAGDSFLLLDDLSFTQAVAVPFALFGVAAAAWVVMWFRRL